MKTAITDNVQFDLFLAGAINAWTDFAPNSCGYQSRDLPGLDSRYFVAQQSLNRFDVIESERGHTRAMAQRCSNGWELRVEITTKQLAPEVFQTMEAIDGEVFPTPQAAILAFNDVLSAWQNPASVTLAQYLRVKGGSSVHRVAVMNDLVSHKEVASEVLADYSDLVPKVVVAETTEELAVPVESNAQQAEPFAVGVRVTFTPFDPNGLIFTGLVRESIHNQRGDRGYHIVTDLEKGWVERVWETAGTITPAAEEVAEDGLVQVWQMTREQFFDDADLVAKHLEGDARGFCVHYKYLSPSPGGPFKGSKTLVMAPKPVKGDVISMMFGKAEITSVTKAKAQKLDNLQLYEGGKVTHRKIVEEAVAAGKPVPDVVLADYPDLNSKGVRLTGEREGH
jgi:hypothetical protein